MPLEVTEVSMIFGGVTALNKVSFSVGEGSIFGLIGPNGAGKTTMFNVVAGVFKPTSGSVMFNGHRLDAEPNYFRVKRGISRTFQNIRLFQNMTVLENIVVGMHTKLRCTLLEAIMSTSKWKTEEEKAREEATEFLKTFGLGGRINDLARSLPYGEQRILEMARALVTGAPVILLDEPAAGLNPVESVRLIDLIRMIREKIGRTVLLVEHDMSVVMDVCEYIVVLDHGVKIAEGLPSEIKKNKMVIEAYLGRRYANEAGN
jgi:branched-chain amino acid transport system ATP-binding protein